VTPHQIDPLYTMAFPQRLTALRKTKRLTQQALAEKIGMSVMQIRRYEAGTSQPTLDVIKKLAVALTTSADALVFEEDERGPDDDLRLQFEAVSQLPQEHKDVVRTVLEGIILKYEATRWPTRPRRGAEAAQQ
jgi:transcriptional regulator with XRE-family HTH domain